MLHQLPVYWTGHKECGWISPDEPALRIAARCQLSCTVPPPREHDSGSDQDPASSHQAEGHPEAVSSIW
jgi:hypothetical protein